MAQFGRYSSSNPLRNLPGQVMGLMDFMEKKKATKSALDISKRRMGLEEEKQEAELMKRTPAEKGMEEGQVEGSLKAAPLVSQLEALKNQIDTPISPGEFALMDSQIKNWAKQNAIQPMDKALMPFKNFAENLRENGATRYQTYKASKDNWDNLKEEPLQAIKSAMDKSANDPKAQEKLKEIYNTFDSGKILDSVFSASYQYDQELKRKAMPKPSKTGMAALIRSVTKPDGILEKGAVEKIEKWMSAGKGSITEKREKQLNAEGQTIERTYKIKNGERIEGSEGKWRTVKDKTQPTNVFYGTDPVSGKPIIGKSKGPVDLKTIDTPSGKGGIAPKTLGRLSAEQQKAIADLGDIERIGGEVKKLITPDVKKWLGPVSGRTRTFAAKFKADPVWTKLKNKASQLRAVVYGLSGKQINEAELRWLKEDILPALEQPGENFLVTLGVLEEWVAKKKANTMKAFRQQGYIVGNPNQGQLSSVQETVPSKGRPPLSSFWE